MSKVTVRQAAFLTGKSRETINTACNDGVLSSTVNERRVKVIDISELERVYPLVRKMEEIGQSEPVKASQVLTDGAPSDLREQVAVLKAKLDGVTSERDLLKAERERERRQLEDEIEHLRISLEKAQEQGGKAMLLLTDQSEGGRNKALEQEQEVRELSAAVQRLSQQNKRIYRELKEQKERGFWKWLNRGGSRSAQ